MKKNVKRKKGNGWFFTHTETVVLALHYCCPKGSGLDEWRLEITFVSVNRSQANSMTWYFLTTLLNF